MDGSRNAVATSATVISAETPKNGPRQDQLPSSPPMSGPDAMPRPSAASTRMIACATEPLEALTMVASADATNSALPSPQPARKPMTAPTLPEAPARPAETMISTSPESRVRFGPIRLDTTPVTSIAMPMIAM